CQWDVREPPPQAKIARGRVRLAARSAALPQPRPSEIQTVTAYPWAIGPNYKASKLQSCTMSRSDGQLGITFVRARDGLSLILESKKCKVDRGKSYPVRLTAGSRSLNAHALAETKRLRIKARDKKATSK